MEKSMDVPTKKLKTEPPYDPKLTFLDIYPKKTERLIWKDTCIPMFIDHYLQQARCRNLNVHWWVKWIKATCVYYTMEYYSVTKRVKSCFCGNTEEHYEIGYRKTDIIIWPICSTPKNKQTNKKQMSTLNKLRDKVHILVVARGRRVRS